MSDLFFATPWWLPTCIIGIGIVLFISGNKRQQPGMLKAGVVVVILALVLIAVSYFVETDKEKVARHTRELIGAVQSGEWDKMKSLLSPEVRLGTEQTTIYPNRDVLVKGAEACVDQYKLKSVSITSLEVTQVETQITVNVNVWSVQEVTQDRPLPSRWQLVWEQNGNDWVVNQITCVSIANEPMNQLASHFLK